MSNDSTETNAKVVPSGVSARNAVTGDTEINAGLNPALGSISPETTVKRFSLENRELGYEAYFTMYEEDYGDWVRFEDYESQASRIYQLEQEAKLYEDANGQLEARIVELEQKVKDQARSRIMVDAEHARRVKELSSPRSPKSSGER